MEHTRVTFITDVKGTRNIDLVELAKDSGLTLPDLTEAEIVLTSLPVYTLHYVTHAPGKYTASIKEEVVWTVEDHVMPVQRVSAVIHVTLKHVPKVTPTQEV